ncbi:hypothetical protein A2V82_02780 [candidate division KSB1 bacterium RBG_16_48_16]|nr:MAG: hypothetical protein A2V82_02780 [candidate division KSB1 bacterium RBG_16_48_16]
MIKEIRKLTQKKVLFLPHALRQMLRPDRMITRHEVTQVISEGELIEDYPDDARGHSCLILGKGDTDRAIHVVCSPKEDYLAVITAYIPDSNEWSSDFKKRKKT